MRRFLLHLLQLQVPSRNSRNSNNLRQQRRCSSVSENASDLYDPSSRHNGAKAFLNLQFNLRLKSFSYCFPQSQTHYTKIIFLVPIKKLWSTSVFMQSNLLWNQKLKVIPLGTKIQMRIQKGFDPILTGTMMKRLQITGLLAWYVEMSLTSKKIEEVSPILLSPLF